MRAFFEFLGRLAVATPILLAVLLILAVAAGLVFAAGRFAVHMGGLVLLAIIVAMVAVGVLYRMYGKRTRDRKPGNGTPNDITA